MIQEKDCNTYREIGPQGNLIEPKYHKELIMPQLWNPPSNTNNPKDQHRVAEFAHPQPFPQIRQVSPRQNGENVAQRLSDLQILIVHPMVQPDATSGHRPVGV
jgi:hypothetical protein